MIIDVIHGEIVFPDIIARIIETPTFERLKHIRQLGCVYKICKPAQDLTRYSHCIGTYHLAARMLNALEKNSKFTIPEFYKQSVEIAALLHDVGHGPFSHLWEHLGTFDHEENSSGCIDTIFENINLSSENQMQLIKALIQGKPSLIDEKELIDKKLLFIFEIVHNKQCGIDVDKWDYLKRDAHYCKELIRDFKQLDFDVLFDTAKISHDGRHIEYDYKHYDKIYSLYEARQHFHINIYQHPKVRIYENVLLEALKLLQQNNISSANIDGMDIFEITSKDADAFLKLTDDKVIDVLKKVPNNNNNIDIINCFEKGSFEEVEDKRDVPDYLIADIKVKYAGEELKDKYKGILFYGDPSDKLEIEEEEGYYEKKMYFKWINTTESI